MTKPFAMWFLLLGACTEPESLEGDELLEEEPESEPDDSVYRAAGDQCWNEGAMAHNPQNAGLEVFRVARAPDQPDDPDYLAYPVTHALSFSTLWTPPAPTDIGSVKRTALVWGNRCHPGATTTPGDCVGWGTKASPATVDGIKYKVFFTTRTKADACTLARVQAHAGYALPLIRGPVERAGLAFARNRTELEAAPRHLRTLAERRAWAGPVWYPKYDTSWNDGPWVLDVCFVPEAPGGALEGVAGDVDALMFDWEVADKRTGAQTAAFMESVRRRLDIARSDLKVFISHNPTYATGGFGGIDAVSGPRIRAALENVTVHVKPAPTSGSVIASINAQIDGQLRTLNGGASVPSNVSKVMIQYDLTTDEDWSAAMRSVMLARGFKMIMLGQAFAPKSCRLSRIDPASATYDPAEARMSQRIQRLLGLPAL